MKVRVLVLQALKSVLEPIPVFDTSVVHTACDYGAQRVVRFVALNSPRFAETGYSRPSVQWPSGRLPYQVVEVGDFSGWTHSIVFGQSTQYFLKSAIKHLFGFSVFA